MSTYASRTETPVAKSKTEIERILARYGASAFGYATEGSRAQVTFKANGRFIALLIPLPDPEEPRFIYTTRNGKPLYGSMRSADAKAKAHEQACRQVWRALALVIKAKLEAVDAGIATFENEFLAYTRLPNGETVGAWLEPQIVAAYEIGSMPSMLIALPASEVQS